MRPNIRRGTGSSWRSRLGVGIAAAALAALLGVLIYTGWQLWRFLAHLDSLSERARRIEAALAAEPRPDIDTVHRELAGAGSDARQARSALSRVPWLGLAPVAGDWWATGRSLLEAAELAAIGGAEIAAALKPHQSELFGEGELGQRGEALLEALRSAQPDVNKAARLLARAREVAGGARPESLPRSFWGLPARARAEQLVRAINDVGLAAEWLPHLPGLLGADGPRRYLLLFQDSGELRATGGFLAAFAYLEVKNGHIELASSEDIFELPLFACPDNAVPEEAVRLAEAAGPDAGALDLLVSHLWAGGIPVQDSNWWPDLDRAMRLFLCHYDRSGRPPVDGVILMDMWFLVGLLEETGPVEVLGYAEPFSAESITYLGVELPQAVYQVLFYAEIAHRHQPDRKRVVTDLSQALLDRVQLLPLRELCRVGGRMLTLAREGHLLVYFPQEELQGLVERSPLGGRLVDAPGDYLYLVEANYAGCKCNLFLKRHVTSRAFNDGQTVSREVRVTYQNPAPPDGWLNKAGGAYVVRAYVPRGARLVSSSGHMGGAVTYEDHGRTVFAFLLRMPAPGTVELSFTYTLPQQLGRQLRERGYHLYVQRQPGLPPLPLSLDVMGKRTETVVTGRGLAWVSP